MSGPGNALHDYAVENDLRNVTAVEENDYQYNTNPLKRSLVTAKDVAWAANAILDAVPTTYYKDELRARASRLAGEP